MWCTIPSKVCCPRHYIIWMLFRSVALFPENLKLRPVKQADLIWLWSPVSFHPNPIKFICARPIPVVVKWLASCLIRWQIWTHELIRHRKRHRKRIEKSLWFWSMLPVGRYKSCILQTLDVLKIPFSATRVHSSNWQIQVLIMAGSWSCMVYTLYDYDWEIT
jgi:hypothetical protein